MSEPNVETILAAKKVARENGYDVSLPDNKLDIAKNIATAAGYNVRKATDLDIAMQTVKNAGYKIEKIPDAPTSEPANKPAESAPATTPAVTPAETKDTAPAPTPEDVKNQEDKNYSWIEQVAASLM